MSLCGQRSGAAALMATLAVAALMGAPAAACCFGIDNPVGNSGGVGDGGNG